MSNRANAKEMFSKMTTEKFQLIFNSTKSGSRSFLSEAKLQYDGARDDTRKKKI